MGFSQYFSNLRPSIKHGLLAGTVIILVKLVFVMSNNWSLRFALYYPILSFLPIYAALIIAGKTEREIHGSNFGYKKALKSAFLTILIVVLLAFFAEFIIYNLNENIRILGNSILRENLIQSFKLTPNLYSVKEKDELIKAIDAASFIHTVSQMFVHFLLNGMLALIIALFTRYKAPKNDWLNQES